MKFFEENDYNIKLTQIGTTFNNDAGLWLKVNTLWGVCPPLGFLELFSTFKDKIYSRLDQDFHVLSK